MSEMFYLVSVNQLVVLANAVSEEHISRRRVEALLVDIVGNPYVPPSPSARPNSRRTTFVDQTNVATPLSLSSQSNTSSSSSCGVGLGAQRNAALPPSFPSITSSSSRRIGLETPRKALIPPPPSPPSIDGSDSRRTGLGTQRSAALPPSPSSPSIASSSRRRPGFETPRNVTSPSSLPSPSIANNRSRRTGLGTQKDVDTPPSRHSPTIHGANSQSCSRPSPEHRDLAVQFQETCQIDESSSGPVSSQPLLTLPQSGRLAAHPPAANPESTGTIQLPGPVQPVRQPAHERTGLSRSVPAELRWYSVTSGNEVGAIQGW